MAQRHELLDLLCRRRDLRGSRDGAIGDVGRRADREHRLVQAGEHVGRGERHAVEVRQLGGAAGGAVGGPQGRLVERVRRAADREQHLAAKRDQGALGVGVGQRRNLKRAGAARGAVRDPQRGRDAGGGSEHRGLAGAGKAVGVDRLRGDAGGAGGGAVGAPEAETMAAVIHRTEVADAVRDDDAARAHADADLDLVERHPVDACIEPLHTGRGGARGEHAVADRPQAARRQGAPDARDQRVGGADRGAVAAIDHVEVAGDGQAGADEQDVAAERQEVGRHRAGGQEAKPARLQVGGAGGGAVGRVKIVGPVRVQVREDKASHRGAPPRRPLRSGRAPSAAWRDIRCDRSDVFGKNQRIWTSPRGGQRLVLPRGDRLNRDVWWAGWGSNPRPFD